MSRPNTKGVLTKLISVNELCRQYLNNVHSRMDFRYEFFKLQFIDAVFELNTKRKLPRPDLNEDMRKQSQRIITNFELDSGDLIKDL